LQVLSLMTNFDILCMQMNTMRAEFADASIWHTEGGWPKDVNIADQEVVLRYRKKLEKDEAFQAAVPLLTDVLQRVLCMQKCMLNIS